MASKFHTRSNSLPNGSHPCSSRVQEGLNKLRTFEATSTSSSESIVTGLSFLEDLYISLADLLNVASTQKAISHHQGDKSFEELLDGSIKVLDVCGITRDTVMQIKENVQSLHSALRRRKADSCIEKSVSEYSSFSKKTRKNLNRLITSLKHLQTKLVASPLLNQLQDDSILMEVIAVNMSVFQSLLSFLAGPPSKSRATKWMNKLIGKEENSENLNELQLVDSTLSTLLNDGSSMQIAYGRLEALEAAIESIEIALENLFRVMIKTRASLLNIMTQ